MRFTKMHGAGNDYVYVDCFEEQAADSGSLARAMSDRHTGVGADGLILIRPPERAGADARMEMYNADGSRGAMCGNGIRCVGKYLYERRGIRKPLLIVETDSGEKRLELECRGGRVEAVTVDMGPPVWESSRIPLRTEKARFIDETIPESGGLRATCVSMGNPHCVLFLDEPATDAEVRTTGAALERNALFSERANIGFAHVVSRSEIRLRVWERGSGETRACGTGACAALAAAALTGRTGREATVRLPGGDLRVRWADDDRIRMTGPAVEVFTGVWPD